MKVFGIVHKVSYLGFSHGRITNYVPPDSWTHGWQCGEQWHNWQQLKELLLGQFYQVNHAWCFLHIINLIAKSLFCQFELLKVKLKDLDINPRDQELYQLGDGSYVEELEMAKENDINDEEGWVNHAIAVLSEAEQKEVTEAMWPVKLVLVKVSTACLMANFTHTMPFNVRF